MNESLKLKVYRSVVRYVTLYYYECWAATEDNGHSFPIMQTEMLNWISGITRYYNI